MKNSLKGMGILLDLLGAIALVVSILFLFSSEEYRAIGISTIIPSILIIALGEICIGMKEMVDTLHEINTKLDK